MGSSSTAASGGGGGVPPGFRFHPTDEELLHFYLKKKISFQKFDMEVIREVDLNKLEPWDLQERCRIGSTPQNEWYFFSHKDRKYPTGSRTNRATNAGFWKATGRDKCIRNTFKKIGMRKTLVFYRGRAPHGQKTDWIMHEYRLEDADDDPQQTQEDGWVVCRVFKKKNLFKIGSNEGHHTNTSAGGMMQLSSINNSCDQVMNMMTNNTSTTYNHLYSRSSASASAAFSQRPSDYNNNLQQYLLQHQETAVGGGLSYMNAYPHHEVLEAQNFMMSHIEQQQHIHINPPVMIPTTNPVHVKQFIMSSSNNRDHEYSCSTADRPSPVSDPYQACENDQLGGMDGRDQPSLAMNVARTSDDDRDCDQSNLNDWDGLVNATSSHQHKGSANSNASMNQINQLSLRGEMDFWNYNGK